jgi:MFS family permease
VTADPVPGRRATLVLLAAALLPGMATWFSASAVVPQLREEWSLSSTAAAWLTIGVQIGFVVGALLSAVLSLTDVFPPRRVLVISAVGAAVANLLLVTADGPATAIPLRVLTGAFLAGVYPPALKLIATWYRSAERGVALGVLVGALTVGSALPHLVNSLGGLPWRQVVAATSVVTVVGAAVAVLVHDGPYPFPRAPFDPSQAGRVFANRGVRLASLGYFGHMWELYAMWAWFVVFFRDSLIASGHESDPWASLATFAVISAGALGCYLGGVLGDRWGRSPTTALAMAISGTCAITIGLAFGHSPWLVLAIGLVWGVTVVADSAQFSTAVTEVADQSYVGTAVTLQLATGFTLTVVTIWLVPVVREATSWSWAFAMLAAGPALGIAAMLRLRNAPEALQMAGGRG